jgi:uncharacterized protein RhaS with RHS repeats
MSPVWWPNRELEYASARFSSVDPAAAGWNAYTYPSNPNSSIDPSGLWGCSLDYCGPTNGWDVGYALLSPGEELANLPDISNGFDPTIVPIKGGLFGGDYIGSSIGLSETLQQLGNCPGGDLARICVGVGLLDLSNGGSTGNS